MLHDGKSHLHNWSWSKESVIRLKRRQTVISERIKLFTMGESVLEEDQDSLCNTEVVAAKLWRAVGWANHDDPVAVTKALKHAMKWRSITWWRDRSALGMATESTNERRWKHA